MSHRPSDRPDGADSLAIEHETVDRIANAVVTLVPLALLGLAIWLAWGGALHWQDLVVLAVSYMLTVAGITVGYHRLFTHRSFRTSEGGWTLLGERASDEIALGLVGAHVLLEGLLDVVGEDAEAHAGS